MKIIGKNSAGDIKADLRTFQYDGSQRERPILIKGPLVNTRRGGKRKQRELWPLSLLSENGTYLDLRPDNTNAGHLIAAEFGGIDAPENLVPMYAGFNQHGLWRQLESALAILVRSGDNGRITLSVGIEYQGKRDPRIPARFTVRVDSGTGGVWQTSLPHDPPVAERHMVDPKDIEVVNACKAEMLAQRWTLERWARSQQSSATPLGLPELGVPRPYAVLDYMTLVKGGSLGKTDLKAESIGNGRGFTSHQRRLILLVNRIEGHGWLYPDDSNDVYAHCKLLTVAGDRGPHIDHIVPRASSGCNAYSNAQVLSAAGNMSLGRKVEVEEGPKRKKTKA